MPTAKVITVGTSKDLIVWAEIDRNISVLLNGITLEIFFISVEFSDIYHFYLCVCLCRGSAGWIIVPFMQ